MKKDKLYSERIQIPARQAKKKRLDFVIFTLSMFDSVERMN
jgi:hypothetical protein